MTAVRDSVLYKTLKKAVRKEDHAELLRMLEMVPESAYQGNRGFSQRSINDAFWWDESPQGFFYWSELSRRLRLAGHDCY